MIAINHEYYVSLEVAKLLKEAGFDWECNHAICCDGTHYPNLKEGDVLEYNHLECSELMEGKKPHMLLCPTLDVAQRWLREVKNIILSIDISPSYYDRKPMGYKFVIHISCGNYIYGEWKDTYEEAKETGIKKALEILEKGE